MISAQRLGRLLTAAAVLSLVLGLAVCPPAEGEPTVYFSPRGGAQGALVGLFDQAQHHLDLAIFDLNNPAVVQAILDAQARGVAVRVVADQRQAATPHSQVPHLAQHVPVRLWHGVGGGIMHDKVAIVDGTRVATGSYNWTVNAERHNHENLLILDDPALVAAYQAEFERLWDGP